MKIHMVNTLSTHHKKIFIKNFSQYFLKCGTPNYQLRVNLKHNPLLTINGTRGSHFILFTSCPSFSLEHSPGKNPALPFCKGLSPFHINTNMYHWHNKCVQLGYRMSQGSSPLIFKIRSLGQEGCFCSSTLPVLADIKNR